MLLEDLLDELQWGSNIQKQDNQYYVELEHWSPLGEDVIDVIWFKEKTIESFLEALEEYKENIQERYMEDAELYIAERPRGTEEFSAKELIEDAEDKIKEFEEYYSKTLQIVKGQFHGIWGGCAVIPSEDEYIVIEEQEEVNHDY